LKTKPNHLTCLVASVLLAATTTQAQTSAQPLSHNLAAIDASGATAQAKSGHLHMGTNVTPNGERLEINSQYLLKNGQPWLPVMGEFHYSRSPEASWEAELQKMKSAGIDVVSSYVIWSHHEEREGRFNWKGNRDLRHFIQLCSKIGLKVVVRLGPWSHAEVRYGGVPEWVVNAMPTRSDDAQYLPYVARLYAQIGEQLKGQLWKQGGPIIGVQIENEYNLSGVGQGAQHIKTLKALALKSGIDVPLYTVTGWDNTIYPQGEVVPVFGGYPDEPWGISSHELPPKETYAFRFDRRVSGDLGAQTAATASGTAELDAKLTPFLGAEYGAGLPAMYRRRTVVSPDDIASMLPVQLGSGVNLMGYYMFHGGRNPISSAGTFMQESSQSGGYNDTTAISYDFQAPLGPDGQQRPVLELLRPYHYFLHDFGARLAPMTVRKPEQVPANEGDLSSLRWSVRSQGDSGFLFVNNHVRQYAMQAHTNVRFSIKLPTETLVFPQQEITIADGQYFMWPINFDLGGITLRYATAQPIARLDLGTSGVTYVFSASAGIPVELGFDSNITQSVSAPNAKITKDGEHLIVSGIESGGKIAATIKPPNARPIHVLVLNPQQVKQLAIGQFAGQRRLILSSAQTYFANDGLQLRAVGENNFKVEIYPAISNAQLKRSTSLQRLQQQANDGEFQVLTTTLPAHQINASATLLRDANIAPPVLIGGLAKAALEPKPESFSAAAAWNINFSETQLSQLLASPELDDVLLNIDFVGDMGRLFSGVHMLDDWYYWGFGWQVGLKQHAAELKRHQPQPLTLSVLPLRADAPIYLPKQARPDFGTQSQIATLRHVSLTPVYRLNLQP